MQLALPQFTTGVAARQIRRHTGRMPDENPTRAGDLVKAPEIIRRYSYDNDIPPNTHEIFAKAIADGIAFGRLHGLAMVAKDILRRKLGGKGENDA